MPTSRRRWFRFSLRTLFVVVTVAAVWLGWELKHIHERRQFVEWVIANDGTVTSLEELEKQCAGRTPKPPGRIPFWRSWLGDRPIAEIAVPNGSESFKEGIAWRLFPEAVEVLTMPPPSSQPQLALPFEESESPTLPGDVIP